MGEATRRWSWGALYERALFYAHRVRSIGIESRQVCALILRHHSEFYPLYMGVSLAGAIPAVLAYPNPRIHPDKFRDGVTGMSRTSGLDWILTEQELRPVIEPLVSVAGSTIRGVAYPLSDNVPRHTYAARTTDAAATEPCLLQHSSGTTGLQKAVTLSHRAVLEHVDRYGEAIRLSGDDRIVSWLPLYHDMGLIAAFHLPLARGVTTVQLDPFEWIAAPALFLQACSRESGTLAWLPNFAYNVMAMRTNDEDLEEVRLDTLRLLVNCSEPVRAESHDRFAARFAAYGLKRHALSASYAMAETTFAVTQSTPGSEARTVDVSRDAISRGIVTAPAAGEPKRACVSSGSPISGCTVRVVSAEGQNVPEGTIGELLIQSVSMFDGYRNNPETTAAVLRDGWYSSGDYGFRLGGEIFVVGRKKDVIIVAGKNVYPEDVEDAINGVSGVVPGRVVAFGIDDPINGTERIAVVAETSTALGADRDKLKRAIIEAGMHADIAISEVYLVDARWLIKSSAGKPSRQANKMRALTELTAAARS